LLLDVEVAIVVLEGWVVVAVVVASEAGVLDRAEDFVGTHMMSVGKAIINYRE